MLGREGDMGIEARKFGWLRWQPLWKQNQAWRERQAAMRESFQFANSTASSTFATAQIKLTSGLASLAAHASIERLQAVTSAKQTQVDKLV
jgi:hypothetical protein